MNDPKLKCKFSSVFSGITEDKKVIPPPPNHFYVTYSYLLLKQIWLLTSDYVFFANTKRFSFGGQAKKKVIVLIKKNKKPNVYKMAYTHNRRDYWAPK